MGEFGITLNWSILAEPHGLFVTCYRPIVIIVNVVDNQPSHIQGSLYIETFSGSDSYEDTGVKMNGYSNNNDNNYVINVADYCQNYFIDEKDFYNGGGFCTNFNKMLSRAFKVVINPVLFQIDGSTNIDYEQELTSNPFIVPPLVTGADESTSLANDNIRIDKFVNNGTNNSSAPWGDSSWNRLTTNMPQNNTIDINSGFYYFQTLLYRGVSGITTKLKATNNTTGNSREFSLMGSSVARHAYIHIHPVIIEFLLALQYGSFQNLLINETTGLLLGNSMTIQLEHKNSAGVIQRTSPAMTYKLIDSSTTPLCQNEKFIFRNQRGGFDWFIATGQKDKEINVSGDEFDRQTDFNRLDTKSFGTIRGQHANSSLLNSRKETFTTFSQPLVKKYSNWLEELIVSPQVWIVKDVTDWATKTSIANNNKRLVAINIIKGSYKLHSTEKNTNFIEFKYNLSENDLTQKL
jgi:hypothetical protein